MGMVLSIQSFRGGTGKSNLTANVAYLVAQQGLRVAVVDTDLRSPGVHHVFGFDQKRIVHTLSEFIFGECDLEEAAYDLSDSLNLGNDRGAIYLLPSRMTVEAIMKVVKDGFDAGALNQQLKELVGLLNLDFLFLDTHPGFNKETVFTISMSDTLVILIRPNVADYEGTAMLAEVATRIGVPRIYMVANKVVAGMDQENVKQKIFDAYKCEVIGVLPLSEDMARLGSRDLFTVRHRNHPLSLEFESIAERLVADLSPKESAQPGTEEK